MGQGYNPEKLTLNVSGEYGQRIKNKSGNIKMTEFFNMGGYAFFVWTSYGITALVLVANIISANLRERQIKRDVAMRLERQNNAPTT